MSATLEQLEPSANGSGNIGTNSLRWGEGHFASLYVNGGAVAPLASPTFTGTPAGPTAAPGTNTTQLASTAFVTAADVIAKARANHTGTQLAVTISDFDSAVTASTAGAKAHDQNSDTKLDDGNANEVTAAHLRAHLDDATKHRQINDATTSETTLWSSTKVDAAIAAAAGGAVDTAQLVDEAVTGAKVEGGTAAPGNNKYWGTNGLGTFGFHTMSTAVKVSLSSGEGQLSNTGGLHAVLGSTDTTSASGADARFPTSGEKAALAGQTGTPSGSNKYLTLDWATADVFTNAVILAGTSTTPGRITPAQIKLAANPSRVALTYAATLTPDCLDGRSRSVTMTGDLLINAPINPVDAMVMKFKLLASGGARELTFHADIKMPTDSTYEATVASGATRMIELEYNGTAWMLIKNLEFAA